jgi:glycosyltransferase involved in cell wall biosynthesis
MKKILIVHLLNDFSGSPLVLSTAVRNFLAAGHQVEILTSKGGEGFLSDIEKVRYHHFSYQFHENKAKRALALLWAQAQLFFKVLRLAAKPGTLVYVNTLLPFGAALAGCLLRKKVVYHLHETKISPPMLKNFMKLVASACASEAIYVSQFLKEKEPMPRVKSTVVYNCLTDDFMKRAEAYLSSKSPKAGQFTVLMLCTLKEYKGVNEYVKLAGLLPDFRFVLVLSTPYEEVLRHFDGQELPDNLVLFPVQRSVHSFYQEAHVVLNLSHPVDCMEAFGMTLLEGMSYGLPVIGPPVGGPAELVKDGYNGYRVDQRNLPVLMQKLRELEGLAEHYHQLSTNARKFAERFSERQFAGELVRVVGLS